MNTARGSYDVKYTVCMTILMHHQKSFSSTPVKHCEWYLKALSSSTSKRGLHVQGKKTVFRTRYCGSFVTVKYEYLTHNYVWRTKICKGRFFSESADEFVISSNKWTFYFPHFWAWKLEFCWIKFKVSSSLTAWNVLLRLSICQFTVDFTSSS